jgi:hypothetical protein
MRAGWCRDDELVTNGVAVGIIAQLVELLPWKDIKRQLSHFGTTLDLKVN